MAISSGPVCCLGEEAKPLLTTASLQAVVECNEVSPEPPLLQTEQSQLPQPLLIRLVLQTPHQFRCPSLDTLQGLNVFLWAPGTKTEHGTRGADSPQLSTGDDDLPAPAGHTISNAGHDAVGPNGHLGTLLARVQPSINQHPHVPFLFTVIQPLSPKPVALHGLLVAKEQDPALGLVEPPWEAAGAFPRRPKRPSSALPVSRAVSAPLPPRAPLRHSAARPVCRPPDEGPLRPTSPAASAQTHAARLPAPFPRLPASAAYRNGCRDRSAGPKSSGAAGSCTERGPAGTSRFNFAAERSLPVRGQDGPITAAPKPELLLSPTA